MYHYVSGFQLLVCYTSKQLVAITQKDLKNKNSEKKYIDK